jgi:hypothetical protein
MPERQKKKFLGLHAPWLRPEKKETFPGLRVHIRKK